MPRAPHGCSVGLEDLPHQELLEYARQIAGRVAELKEDLRQTRADVARHAESEEINANRSRANEIEAEEWIARCGLLIGIVDRFLKAPPDRAIPEWDAERLVVRRAALDLVGNPLNGPGHRPEWVEQAKVKGGA